MRHASTKSLGISLAVTLLLGACTQFTTNEEERTQLRAAADAQAEAYLGCVRKEAASYADTSTDASFIYAAVADRCVTELNAYRASAQVYFESKVMMAEKPVEAEVEELGRRAQTVIAEVMVAGMPVAASRTTSVPPRREPALTQVAAPAAVAGVSAGPEQRVYLDCMLEQAKRYMELDESADTIAEVAQNNCRAYLAGSNQAALAEQGRALVLSEVFDARINPRP